MGERLTRLLGLFIQIYLNGLYNFSRLLLLLPLVVIVVLLVVGVLGHDYV